MEKVCRLIFFILIYAIRAVINFFIFLYNCKILVFDSIILIDSGKIKKKILFFASVAYIEVYGNYFCKVRLPYFLKIV